MTEEEMVGKLMAALARMQVELSNLRETVGSLQNTVAQQTSQIATLNTTNQHLATEVMQLRAIVERLPCNDSEVEHDTNPECLNSIRPKLRSISEEEPDSALLRQMEVSVSKSGFKSKGPSGMILAWTGLIGAIGGLGLALWTWLKHQLP